MNVADLNPAVQLLLAMGLLVFVVGIVILGRGMSLKFGRAEVRFDNLDTKTSQIKTRTDSTDKQLNGRKTSDTTVSADVAYIRRSMDEMREMMNDHHGVVAEVKTTAAAAAGDAAVVKEVVLKQVGIIAGQQATLEALKGTVRVHGVRLEEIEKQQNS